MCASFAIRRLYGVVRRVLLKFVLPPLQRCARSSKVAIMRPQVLIVLSLFFTLVLVSCRQSRISDSSDPVQTDAKHHRVEFENAHIRVLRAHYGAHEKSPMHSHPANIVIGLSGGRIRVTDAAGNATEGLVTEHSIGNGPALIHSVENLTDMPYEVVVIELKD